MPTSLTTLTTLTTPSFSLCWPVPGVLNAFVIMIIVMAIYAIIGVEIFATFGEGGEFTTWQQTGAGATAITHNTSVSSVTLRGFDYGQEYYGTFSRALFTLFQARAAATCHLSFLRRPHASSASILLLSP